MDTRITMDVLIGETKPTYFVDYMCHGCWKNHSSSKDADEALRSRQELLDAQNAVA